MSRCFLVTGGSRGLGLALCRHYVEGGGRVLTCARHVTAEIEALRAEWPDAIDFRELDLSRPEAPSELLAAALEQLGGVDVLVNNAALAQDSLLAHTSEEEIERIVALNVTATIRLTRLVVRRMVLQGGGVVLNVSSIGAIRGYSGLAVYSATKGALDAFTRSLAQELGGSGIRVNAVAPGFFNSDMTSVLAPGQVDAIRRRTPTGRLATVEDVVQAAEVLIAPDGNVTGQVLVVDGGASIA
jgi:3-oxoacyl-[acyl-carrier protein] reductase